MNKKQSIKQKAEETRDQLVDVVTRETKENVLKFLEQHKQTITEIYNEYGGGSEYLLTAYGSTHISKPEIAVAYQQYLEREIAGDVLFLDE